MMTLSSSLFTQHPKDFLESKSRNISCNGSNKLTSREECNYYYTIRTGYQVLYAQKEPGASV